MIVAGPHSATGGPARRLTKIETDTSLQQAEQLKVLSKPKQLRVRRRQVNNE